VSARRKNDHCSYCGAPFVADQPWPRACAGCASVSYLNPSPVSVLLLPVDGGLLCVRRDIEPGRGQLALPGGFMEVDETWQEAAVRELEEEAGIVIEAGEVGLFAAHSVPHQGLLLLFGLVAPRALADLPPFVPTEEATERVVLPGPIELAFPLHTLVMREYFARRG
jgi:ADP-ribose pyrophosphatase YjhB (NUDIX family)